MDPNGDLSNLAQQRLRQALGEPEPGAGPQRWVLHRAGLDDKMLTVTLQATEEPLRISVLLNDPGLPAASENTVFIMQSMVELDALIASIRRRTGLVAGSTQR